MNKLEIKKRETESAGKRDCATIKIMVAYPPVYGDWTIRRPYALADGLPSSVKEET